VYVLSDRSGRHLTHPDDQEQAMTIMTNPGDRVAGIDSHKGTIHIAVITATGLEVTDHEFATTTVGYRKAVAWLAKHGPVAAVGIEGTSSYGVGITAALRRNGIQVVEVNRTRPAERRKQGKTDRLDAYRAARSVISGEATTHPKRDTIESLRALVVTRRSANKSLQACWRQIGSILVNANPRLRDKYRYVSRDKLIDLLAASRPDQVRDLADATILRALRSLARRHQYLRGEIDDLDEQPTPTPPRGTPGCAPSTASARPWPRSWWSPPVTIPSGCAAQHPSPRSAGPAQSPCPPARPNATACPAAVTDERTGPCTRSSRSE